jgi:hypothetical protein
VRGNIVRMSLLRSVPIGAVAGAVGTVVLDVTTYADTAVRGRPSSNAPAELVKRIAASAGIETLAADDETASNRRSGTGALLGYANGVGLGVVYGTLRPALRGVPVVLAGLAAGAAAMAASDIPLTKTGVTDPKTWGTAGWLADIIPHALYGLALAYTFDALEGGEPS